MWLTLAWVGGSGCELAPDPPMTCGVDEDRIVRADAHSLDELPASAGEIVPEDENNGVSTLAGIGDLDDDGIGDYAIVVEQGGDRTALVFSGADGMVGGDYASLAEHAPLTTIRNMPGGLSLGLVAGRSDVDGDGREELLLRGRSDDTEQAQTELWIVDDPLAVAEHDLSADPLVGMRVVATGWEEVEYPTRVIGDLDGDGADELVARLRVAGGEGVVEFVLVPGGALVDELDIGPLSDRRLGIYARTNPLAGEASLGAVGDLDGDGVAELVVLDGDAGVNGGIVVIFGVVLQQLLADAVGVEPPPLAELLAAGTAAVIESPTATGLYGHDFLVIDDLDDDGSRELVIAAEHIDQRGQISIVFGGAWAASQTFDELDATGRLIQLDGERDRDRAEWASVGDFDGDGRDDLIVVARTAKTTACASGLIYVLPGDVAASGWSLAEVETGTLGALWTGPSSPVFGPAFPVNLGDVSGDGIDDVAVRSLEGRAWLLSGSSLLVH